MLYRRPTVLEASTKELSKTDTLELGLKLGSHGLPYALLLILAARMVLSELFGGPDLSWPDSWAQYLSQQIGLDPGILFGLAAGILFGLASGFAGGPGFGLAFGLIVWLGTGKPISGLFWAIGMGLLVALFLGVRGGLIRGIFGLGLGIMYGVGAGFPFVLSSALGLGLAYGVVGGILFGLRGGLGRGTVLGIVFGISGGLASGPLFGVECGLALELGYLVALLRAHYWPLFAWLSWPKPLGHLYRYHPVAWDDLCLARYPGLTSLLVAYSDHDPVKARSEINRLIKRYPAQRRPALKARTILIARQAAKVERLTDLAGLLSRLPQGDRGYLRQTEQLRNLVQALVAQAARADAAEVPALRAAEAAELCLRVRDVRDQIAGFAEPLASEFLKAIQHWQKLAETLRSETKALAEHAARPQVFRAGDRVVDRGREAFVVRPAVLHELQQQLLLATGCPGIVLYGRRRVGKSSVLCNLDGFLPDSIRAAVVSLQNPRAFTDLPGLCRELHAAVERALPTSPAEGERPGSDPPQTLDALYEFLDRTNETLAGARQQLILGLDEYENLDHKIGEGVFTEDLLACLRESLQSHREIVWVLAGSHEIGELTHAPWASYLVSARTVEVPMFTLEETRALLTDPMKHAPRRREIWEDRPRFEPEFWGPQGIEGIHQQAGGWPHLVQLLAETLLDEVNRRSLASVDATLFEEGLGKAIVRGHNVFHQLLRDECHSEAEWDYLFGFRQSETQPPPVQDDVGRALRRRLLVDQDGAAWRLRVPLMQRWLRDRW
jgi:hypothetical protein